MNTHQLAILRGVLTSAISCLLLLTAVASAQGQEILTERRATGLLPPTPAGREWMDRNMVKARRVDLNKLAVQRINAYRRSQGLPPLDLPTVPLGDEVVPEGAIGLASANNAPAANLPPAADNSKLESFPVVRDQGQLGSCASFSTTYYVGTHMLGLARGWNNKNNDNGTKLSPKWTYDMVNGGQDQGSRFPETIDVLLKHGGATWTDFPYRGETEAVNYLEWSVNPAVWREAINYRMEKSGTISRVHTTAGLNELKALLLNGYALLYATDIHGWQFYTIKNDPSTTDDDPFVGKRICAFVKAIESGHAMTIVGYNDHIWVDLNKNAAVDAGEKGALRICNSWGTDWSPGGNSAPQDGGFTWLAYDALKAASSVPGADNHDRAPGAFDGSPEWRTPFWDNQVHFFTARPAYTPKLLGQFTITHGSREQLKIKLGRSSTSATTPTQTWEPGAMNEAGGDHSFNGGQNAVEGTFVFDFSDITANGPNRYYLLVTDTKRSIPANLQDFRLTDPAGNPLAVSRIGVPGTADSSTHIAYLDYTLSALTITSADTTEGTVDVPLSFTVTATSNPSSFGANGLPPGLTIHPMSGVISGTPSEAGTFTASLSVSSPAGTGSASLTFSIGRPIINPPAITSSTIASGAAGTAFTYAITANGNPTAFGATELPSGLSLNETTGIISGTPTQAGTFTVQLTASNAGGKGVRALTLTINPPPLPAPVITSATTTSIQSGSPFSYRITASNGPTSYGAEGLPTELILDTSTGAISGTPGLARQYTITLSARNASGPGYPELILTVLGESSFGPANDSFSNRSLLIGNAVTVNAGNNNATAETGEPSHANAPAAKSVWWTWTAPAAGTVTISTVGSSFDTLLAVYTGTNVSRLASVSSDDQSGGNNTSQVTFNSRESVTHQIAVDGRNGAVGNVVLNLQFAGAMAAPSNDNFGGRVALSGATTSAIGRNIGASAETGEPEHAGLAASKSVWWSWTAPFTGRATLSTSGSDFDTVLAIYSGSDLRTLRELASDDQSGPNNTSLATFDVTANTAYQIAIDGFDDAAGNILLLIELGAAVSVPANDNFDNNIRLSGSTVSVTGSNENATAQIAEPDHAGFAPEKSVWWTWIAPATGVASIHTAGSNFDTLLAVYVGASLSGLSEVASNDDDDAGDKITSQVTFIATSGTTYHIAVDGFEGFDKGSGNISLTLQLQMGATLNDSFVNRSSLSGSQPSANGANVNATAEAGEPEHDDYPAARSVWWSWTAPLSGRMTLRTTGSSFDTILAIYTGASLAQLVPVASNDDDGDDSTSRVSFLATTGSTYQIAVDGYEGAVGTIQVSGRLIDVGDSLYETDFETFRSGADELVGPDGWEGSNTGEGVHGLADAFEGEGKGAYLGFNVPTEAYVSVYRPLNFDPIGTGRPWVTFSVGFAIVDSTNDQYDTFAFSVYNRAGEFLAAINFYNDDLTIYYVNNDTSAQDTGQTFEHDVPYLLSATVNFAANTWSASLDGVTLFQNQPFRADARTRDLGDISMEWYLSDESDPGDNYLLFDNYSVTASAGARSPSITTQPASQSVEAGDFAIFFVTATATPPLSYQWQFHGTALPGETEDFLLLFDVQSINAGDYSVIISNGAGKITSAPATLTVRTATAGVTLQISLSPQPKIAWPSQAGVSYQVQFTTDLAGPNWKPFGQTISGTGGVVSFTDSTATDSQRFYRIVP